MSNVGDSDSKIFELTSSIAARVKEALVDNNGLSDIFELADQAQRLLGHYRNRADKQTSKRQQQEQQVTSQTQEVSQEPTVGGRGGNNE